MNDNERPPRLGRQQQRPFPTYDAEQIAELSSTALRAVAKPESLTMGEIQEVGWGFLLMAKQMTVRGT